MFRTEIVMTVNLLPEIIKSIFFFRYLTMLVSIFIAMSTILATSQAGLPETCHTRGEINAPGLILDETKWGTAEYITTDQQADTTISQDTVYNDLLKSWMLNPSASGGLNV